MSISNGFSPESGSYIQRAPGALTLPTTTYHPAPRPGFFLQRTVNNITYNVYPNTTYYPAPGGLYRCPGYVYPAALYPVLSFSPGRVQNVGLAALSPMASPSPAPAPRTVNIENGTPRMAPRNIFPDN